MEIKSLNRKRNIKNPYKERCYIVCEICTIKFEVFPYLKYRARFCSRECRWNWLSRSKKRENHHNWKGENATYSAKHKWMDNNLGQPTTCEHCGVKGFRGKKINWANISGKYFRDIKDWLRLCTSCHRIYDFNK